MSLHDTLDVVISYFGSLNYPSAHKTVERWANRNGCTGDLTNTGRKLDLDAVIPGADTKVESYTG